MLEEGSSRAQTGVLGRDETRQPGARSYEQRQTDEALGCRGPGDHGVFETTRGVQSMTYPMRDTPGPLRRDVEKTANRGPTQEEAQRDKKERAERKKKQALAAPEPLVTAGIGPKPT